MFARRSLAALACLLVLLPIHAKDASDQVARCDWQLGALALVRNGGYVGDAKQTLVVPAVGYEGQDVFLRGLQAGWHAWQRGGWRLDLIAQARLDGFDAKDIPIAGLEDRRKNIDVGAALSLSGTMGKLEASAVTDGLNRSGGQELTVSYGNPFLAGHVRITPQVGARYGSSNLADYYYGIDPREVARGAPETHVVGSVVTPEAALKVVAPLSRRWSLGGRCALPASAQRTRPQPPGVGVVSEHLVGGGHLRILNAWSALRRRHLALPPTTWIDLFARQSRRLCGLQIHGAESIAW